MYEETASLTRAGLRVSLTGEEKEMPEYSAVKPKQERAQPDMQAPSLTALCG